MNWRPIRGYKPEMGYVLVWVPDEFHGVFSRKLGGFIAMRGRMDLWSTRGGNYLPGAPTFFCEIEPPDGE